MWQDPPIPDNEVQRVAALMGCGIMDTPREEHFDRVTRLAQRFYKADVAFIGFIDDGYQWLKSSTSNDVPTSIDRRQSICMSIVSTGKPLVVSDLKTDPHFAHHPIVPHLALRFYAGVPLMVTPDLVIGSLCVLRYQPGLDDDFDIQPLQELAAITIDELELMSANRELTRLSRTDALTGLTNRRVFDEELVRAAHRCQRTGEALAVLMIDIDYFKMLNDTLGHQQGDEALRRVGEVLSRVFVRQNDVVARYGGEEFVAILCGSNETGARLVAERLREALAAAGIFHPMTGSLTVSVGICVRANNEIDIDQMLVDADIALYQAKRQGRNSVVSYQPIREADDLTSSSPL